MHPRSNVSLHHAVAHCAENAPNVSITNFNIAKQKPNSWTTYHPWEAILGCTKNKLDKKMYFHLYKNSNGRKAKFERVNWSEISTQAYMHLALETWIWIRTTQHSTSNVYALHRPATQRVKSYKILAQKISYAKYQSLYFYFHMIIRTLIPFRALPALYYGTQVQSDIKRLLYAQHYFTNIHPNRRQTASHSYERLSITYNSYCTCHSQQWHKISSVRTLAQKLRKINILMSVQNNKKEFTNHVDVIWFAITLY